MVKRDLKSGMRASMKLEEDATRERFERAESVFASPEPPAVPDPSSERARAARRPNSKPPVKYVLQTFSISPKDIELLEQLKSVAAEAAFARRDPDARKAALGTNKSELVRIAIALLASRSSSELLDLIVSTKSRGQSSKGRVES